MSYAYNIWTIVGPFELQNYQLLIRRLYRNGTAPLFQIIKIIFTSFARYIQREKVYDKDGDQNKYKTIAILFLFYSSSTVRR